MSTTRNKLLLSLMEKLEALSLPCKVISEPNEVKTNTALCQYELQGVVELHFSGQYNAA